MDVIILMDRVERKPDVAACEHQRCVVMFLNLGHQLAKGETCGDGDVVAGMRDI